jgi:hypothetical protein
MYGFVAKYGKLGQGFSQREADESLEHPGRRTNSHGYQSAASWIDDLGELKQCIILCSFCRAKFNPRKNHYRKFYAADISGITDGHAVNGKCDSCKQFTANCGGGTAYLHESDYPNVCADPMEARRKARAAAGSCSVSRFLNLGR